MTLVRMKFASALSTKIDLLDLIQDLAGQIRMEFGPEKIDLALLFVHPKFLQEHPDLNTIVRRGIGIRHLVGCTGHGIIGNQRECEQEPAVALLAAQLPGVTVTPFRIQPDEIAEATGPEFWHFQLETVPADEPNFLVFVEPFSTDVTTLVTELGTAYPGAPVIGGLASSNRQQGGCQLFLDDEVLDTGAIGLALSGNIELRTVVSQGCRPIGQPFTITRANRNMILELGGRPPLAVLQEMLPQLPDSDQQLAKTAMFLGRVINEYQEEFVRGDFVVRNLLGHDPQSGALAVGDVMRTGQTVQFQVRDGQSATENLQTLLRQEQLRAGLSPVHGALLVSCLGRGTGMFGQPDHDISELQRIFGPVPAAGWFANGEIGPVGGKPFVHGFTTVIGLFAERSEKAPAP